MIPILIHVVMDPYNKTSKTTLQGNKLQYIIDSNDVIAGFGGKTELPFLKVNATLEFLIIHKGYK